MGPKRKIFDKKIYNAYTEIELAKITFSVKIKLNAINFQINIDNIKTLRKKKNVPKYI